MCDCSMSSVGPNPGGRGGGRVRVHAGIELIVNGSIRVDGESAGVYLFVLDPIFGVNGMVCQQGLWRGAMESAWRLWAD